MIFLYDMRLMLAVKMEASLDARLRILYDPELDYEYHERGDEHDARLDQFFGSEHNGRQAEDAGYGVKYADSLLLIESEIYQPVMDMLLVALERILMVPDPSEE